MGERHREWKARSLTELRRLVLAKLDEPSGNQTTFDQATNSFENDQAHWHPRIWCIVDIDIEAMVGTEEDAEAEAKPK